MRDLSDVTKSKALEKSLDRVVQMGLGAGRGMMRVSKAVVTASGREDMAWLDDPDAPPIVNHLARKSVLGRLLALGAPPVPPGRLLPVGGADPDPAWKSPGAPAPMGRITSTTTSAPIASVLLILAFMRELFLNADERARAYALAVLERVLPRAVNSVFLGTAAATDAQPAGLLWNRAPVGSGSPSALADDLELLVASVSNGAPTTPVFVLSPRAAIFLNASGLHAFRDVGLNGGRIAGAPAVIAPEAGANLILIDAAEVGISDSGIEILPSTQAAVQMSDSPTAGATTMVSGWQTNTLFLRVELFVSWALLREDAVAHVTLPISGSPQ